MLNYSVDPCVDFYEHVCSRWVSENPIPHDRTAYTKLTVAMDLIKPVMAGLYNDTKPSTSKAINSIKQYFRACNDLDAINAAGTSAYLKEIESFGGWPLLKGDEWNSTDFDLTGLLINIVKQRAYKLFVDFDAGQDLRNVSRWVLNFDQRQQIMPSREYYLKPMYKPKLLAYRQYMTDMLWLFVKDSAANVTLCDLSKTVDELIEIDVQLANWSKSREERFDYDRVYNLRNLSDLNDLAPAINWTRYIREVSPPEVHEYLDSNPQIVVNEVEYLEKVSDLLNRTDSRTITNYVFWRYTHVFVTALDSRFRAIEDEFNRALVGKKKRALRWRECLTYTIENMPQLSGAVYVRNKFSREAKQVATNMFEELRVAFIRTLNTSVWISPQVKEYGIKKAQEQLTVIGAPDFVFNDTELDNFYEDLNFKEGDTYFDMEEKVQRFEFRRTLRHLLKPSERTEMEMSAAMVNAYNSQTHNKIVVPAAILQEPFFHPNYPKSAIYAAIGQILGHEMGHSFDGQGRQFDIIGNLYNWWDNKTLNIFNNRTKCMVEQYSEFKIKEEPALHVNGELTRDENVADSAYHQYLNKHGKHESPWPQFKNYTDDHMFFFSFANFTVYEDEEQYAKLTEILQLLISAGYFRAKIHGLSAFDKCPHSIEPHQIQGLDCIRIFPVIQWLVKEAIEAKKKHGDEILRYSAYQFDNSGWSVEGGLDRPQPIPRPRARPKRVLARTKQTVTQNLEDDVRCTLLEYGLDASDVVVRAPLVDDEEPARNKKKELETEFLKNLQIAEKLKSELQDIDPTTNKKVSARAVTEMIDSSKLGQIALNSEGLKETITADEELERIKKENENLKLQLSAVEEDKEREMTLVEEHESELANLKDKLNDFDDFMSTVDQELLDETRELLSECKQIRADEITYKRECRSKIQELEAEIERLETNENSTTTTKSNESSGHEQLNELRSELEQINKQIYVLSRQIDSKPTQIELNQYQRRFVELYNQVTAKHLEARRLCTYHNTLVDVCDFVKTEIKLLNNIDDQKHLAISKSYNESFLRNLEELVQNVTGSLTGLMKRKQAVQQKRDDLATTLQQLQDRHRQYNRAVAEFQEE
ncbi:Phosphate-regulating neutral endopeptidase [Aphelenchoides besseyi]|nr:Phosphate-regulating neutral endopeptidase [Aphelenchoides besseyi]